MKVVLNTKCIRFLFNKPKIYLTYCGDFSCKLLLLVFQPCIINVKCLCFMDYNILGSTLDEHVDEPLPPALFPVGRRCGWDCSRVASKFGARRTSNCQTIIHLLAGGRIKLYSGGDALRSLCSLFAESEMELHSGRFEMVHPTDTLPRGDSYKNILQITHLKTISKRISLIGR